jgi:hypothetical protein
MFHLSVQVLFKITFTPNRLNDEAINPSAWGLLKLSSYCGVGRVFYSAFGAKLCRSLFKIM